MELSLTRQAETDTKVNVACDGLPSHSFDLRSLVPNNEQGPPQPPDDPVAYGKALYGAMFSLGTAAQRAIAAMPERLLLVTTDNDLDAIPWEYAYGPDGFLVLECPFARGLPTDQRIPAPVLDTGLHIVAIPSNPLDEAVSPLNIDGEWARLKKIIQDVPYTITLERTRPPTMEQVRNAVANQRHRVVHFMGHGGQDERGAILCFEKDNGALDVVTAKQFALRVRGSVFLVTLNACVSATPGATPFSNLAAALVRQKTPYALGMRLSIHDEDARTFSRTFYSDLARGVSVEEALFQARLTLANSPRQWVLGVPVLYTALAAPATGFTCVAGTSTIKEHQPPIEVSGLPRAEGGFQGRIQELQQLGTDLTGDSRPRIITIHGGGGQGKTALARETVERFAYAWSGGIWATSLENLPDRAIFTNELARFLDIKTEEILDPNEVERQVHVKLATRRMLIVLDNAETLVDAVEANHAAARELAQFIKQLPSNLLVTSRVQLGWSGEVSHELGGLSPEEGAILFRQSAPQRANEIELALAQHLSQQLEGHPFSLRLLAGAFNACAIPLPAFIQECEAQLLKAENKYVDVEHRHRSLYACIETSVRYLNPDLRKLLSGLWIFHAPFLPETAAAIFDPESEGTEQAHSPTEDHIYTLWQRGLLARETITTRDETLHFYRLLPTTRPYVGQHVEQVYEREALLARFGTAYAQLASSVYRELDRRAGAAVIAQQASTDFERGALYVGGIEKGSYLLAWGWILHRLGNPRQGLKWLEWALEIAQGEDRTLELYILNNIGMVYNAIGQPQRALTLYQQALPIHREVENRDGEAATFNNMGLVYNAIGQPQQALTHYQQALPILREVGNRAGEATTLHNMGSVYYAIGQPQQALTLYQQALPIHREVENRAGEATTLTNMALVYQAIGQPQRALTLYQQALPIHREVENRAGEATTLNGMAGVYHAIEQPQRALTLYQQALPIHREVENRDGEATTLNNLGEVYQAIGQPQRALTLYEQALPIRREVGDRAGEATTLHNMALVYNAIGQPQRALTLYEQVLPIMREVGDRAGEATTLNNIAGAYHAIGQPQRAFNLYQQALPIHREVENRAMEATTLSNMAVLLYQDLNRPQEAIMHLEHAIAVLEETGLPQDASGATVDDMQHVLQAMRTGTLPRTEDDDRSITPEAAIQQIVVNTILVMTTVQDRHTEWREDMASELEYTQQQGTDWQIEVDFFTAILAILDGRAPRLPSEHPYAQAVAEIQERIAHGGVRDSDSSD